MISHFKSVDANAYCKLEIQSKCDEPPLIEKVKIVLKTGDSLMQYKINAVSPAKCSAKVMQFLQLNAEQKKCSFFSLMQCKSYVVSSV